MRLVIKLHMIRDVVDPHPGDRCLRVEVPPFLHDLRMLRNDGRVADETQSHGRNACILRSIHIGMTKAATDLLHSRVNPMAKIDRLFGADRLLWIHVVKIKHHPE
jgi:hypothetical protein